MVVIVEEPARGLSPTRRDAVHLRAIDPHCVLLITGSTVTGGLEDQPLAVVAEVRLGVGAAPRELPNISEVRLSRGAEVRLRLSDTGQEKRRDERGKCAAPDDADR